MTYETQGLDTQERVFFYEQEFYVLSNFSSFQITWRGEKFATAEHAYHWAKFIGTDNNIASLVRKAESAHLAYKYARALAKFQFAGWNDVKEMWMAEILQTKASQHEYVRRKLIETGDRELVENSWRDDYWGIGPNGDGQNRLGKLWMDVRKSLLKVLK